MDPASRVSLGKTSLLVSRLGLGSAPLGGLFRPVEEATVHATVRRAYDLGVRLVDTAPLYGHGNAELRLGAALRELPRDEFVLATKVGRLLRADGPPRLVNGRQQFHDVPALNPVFDFSYEGVLRSFEESLARLGLERIDILHIHDPDNYEGPALDGAYRALDRLRSDGVIRAVGAGMNQAEMLARLARAADFDCFLVAGRYTLLDQTALTELLPLCVEKRIAIIIGGVYNSGILTDPDSPQATFNYRPADQYWVDRARRLKAVCDRHGVPLKAAAIQFPLAHSAVATVLNGARSVEELEENARMMEWPIPADLWQELRAERLLPDAAPVPTGA